MLIANRLVVPDGTGALLWDMDGVLLDTLTMDYELVNHVLTRTRCLRCRGGSSRNTFRTTSRSSGDSCSSRIGLEVLRAHLMSWCGSTKKRRESSEIVVHDGVAEILAEAKDRGLRAAVVSNNPVADVERMLSMAGLRDYFNVVVGNDDPGIAKKPAPDAYLEAARRLSLPGAVPPVAVEDSLLGAQAANAAGCWTVGVSKGATDFEVLSSSPHVNRSYTSFAPCRVLFGWAGVTKKSLVTPNEFVSHMIEHIAWRLGCSVDVLWTNDDWYHLGRELGQRIAELCPLQGSAAALGMIDDGSCEVALRCDGTGEVRLRAARSRWTWNGSWACGVSNCATGSRWCSMLHGLEQVRSGPGHPCRERGRPAPHMGGNLPRCRHRAQEARSIRESVATSTTAVPSSPRESLAPKPTRQKRPWNKAGRCGTRPDGCPAPPGDRRERGRRRARAGESRR